MPRRSSPGPDGGRVFTCRCRHGQFRLMGSESPKQQKCPRCLASEQAEIYRRLLHLAPTRGQRRMIRRLTRITAHLITQTVRQAVP